jgi:pimeloyl-ACP methyl ester carboxylesterase
VVGADRGKRAADTPYMLRLQADLNYEGVDIGGTSYTLGLTRADRSSAPILSDAETWVVIHGWLGSPKDIHSLAGAIDAASKHVQVLELDWSEVADNSDAVTVVFDVPDVGAWAARKLTSWGISGANINLVGHSYGGYMTDQIAKNVSGGVDRIVALDPATAALGGIDFSGTNYAAHSQYSLAFIGSD